ncbi:hypothetical protein F1847_03775 [Thermodesulfobacterium sp. TA1]|uniref:sigma 54-interacting transcriptional regulator n=1 Tax=Thermodesulfobacterium sp. TA1 TaxID=2234087 RepID=UPI0012324F71|nr:sigma 54-interacting transcriptional regulator [Thermodesulfobacterium sp. TA1]QER41908.1 hypothetical protein F1847_03775 [Thermodesulfobacterium sp. TA1]
MKNFKKPLLQGLFKIKSIEINPKEFIDFTSLKTLLPVLEKLYNSKIPILLGGESGVGKSFIAKKAHFLFNKEHTFFYLDCLASSFCKEEIFKEIYLLQNQKGTLFVNHIDRLSEEFLETFIKIVLSQSQLKFIASSSAKNLTLNVFRTYFYSLQILPLRERKEDIPEFLAYFLKIFNQKYQKRVFFQPLTIEILKDYPWPANIRELQNLVERLVIFKNKKIYPKDIFEFLSFSLNKK